MKPPVEHIRLNKKARDQLVRIRRSTGIEQWNILCRWALCLSLRDPTCPPAGEGDKSASVEMAWRVFAGDLSDVLAALLLQWKVRCMKDELDDGELVRRHLLRGLALLDSMNPTSVFELVQATDLQMLTGAPR